jgi:hypothetical protein
VRLSPLFLWVKVECSSVNFFSRVLSARSLESSFWMWGGSLGLAIDEFDDLWDWALEREGRDGGLTWI